MDFQQRIFLIPRGEEIPDITDNNLNSVEFAKAYECRECDFEITRRMVEQCILFKNACTDDKLVFIPVENINKEHLKMVVEFLKITETQKMLKIEEPLPSKNMRECVFPPAFADYIEQDYFNDYKNLHQIILAANYIDCNDLLDLTCAKIASYCKGKTKEELRLIFEAPEIVQAPEQAPEQAPVQAPMQAIVQATVQAPELTPEQAPEQHHVEEVHLDL
jgi:hypothetical protein